jgi:hypothetical protein
MVSVGISRRRAVQPRAAPISSASAGIVNRAVRWVTAGARKPASKTPRRTEGSGSLGVNDGATDTSASTQTATPIVPRLQRATAWARAAYAPSMPTSAPSPAQTPITNTGCTPAICAVRAGCMVSGTTIAAPTAAATASPSRVPTVDGRRQRSRNRPPVTAPITADIIANQATQASCAVHWSRVVMSRTRVSRRTPSPYATPSWLAAARAPAPSVTASSLAQVRNAMPGTLRNVP